MHRRGFTLIELMIVVVIIAILAAVIVPSVLSKLERRPTPPPAPVKEEVAEKPERPDGSPLTLADVDLAVTASLAPYVYNLQVRTAYTASVRGALTLRHDSADERAHLLITFP